MSLAYCTQCGRPLPAQATLSPAGFVQCPACGQKNTEIPPSPKTEPAPFTHVMFSRLVGVAKPQTPDEPTLPSEVVAAGHARVSREVIGQTIVYRTRVTTFFGWFWLIFTTVHCFFMFYGLSRGQVRMNHQLIDHASVFHYLFMALFYIPFFLVGFSLALGHYRLLLEANQLSVRWRCFPGVGWTWKLATGDDVRVRLEYRGASSNSTPLKAIVVSSQQQEINFGNFIREDVKRFLAAAIHDYYGDPVTKEDSAVKG